MEDIIDISFDNKTSNFGGGIELLMNDKKKDNTFASDINIEDLNNLENELNDLVNDNSFQMINIAYHLMI